MASNERRANAAYEKAVQQRKDGLFKDAVKDLSALPPYGFTARYVECFNLMVEIALLEDNAAHVGSIGFGNAFKGAKADSQNLDTNMKTVVDIVFKHLNAMVDSMKQKMDAMTNHPSKEDIVLARLSGISVAQRAKECFFDPCQNAFHHVGRTMFGLFGIGLSNKTLLTFMHSARDLFSLCHSLGMERAMESIVASVNVTLGNTILGNPIKSRNKDGPSPHLLAELKANRENFFKSESFSTETVKTLCLFLDVLAAQGYWNPAWRVLSCLKSIADALHQEKGAVESCNEAYVKIAGIFWQCNIITYHAYCLVTSACRAADSADAALATRAVLATLICSATNEAQNPFAPTFDRHKVHDDVVELFQKPKVSRGDMLAMLKLRGAIRTADPLVLPLVEVFEAETLSPDTDFTPLYATVAQLAAKDAALAPYATPLNQALLRRQMELLARTTTRVAAQGLFVRGADVSEEQHMLDVETALLQDTTLPIEIDSKSKTVMFPNASRTKIVDSFARLTATIDVRPVAAYASPCEAVAGASVSSPSNPATVSIEWEHLMSAKDRSTTVLVLQRECVNNAQQRVEDRNKAVQALANHRRHEREEVEKKKRDRLYEQQCRKLAAEYADYERKERRQLVINKLRAKYPKFKVDDAVTAKSDDTFEDDVTRLVADFKRKEAEVEVRDTLRGNLFERAVRQLEIPRRKSIEQENAEKSKAERAAARQNYLIQHRQEYERRQEERAVLKKFAAAAAQFMHELSEKAAPVKASKRDEQQMLLEEEKRRLANAA